MLLRNSAPSRRVFGLSAFLLPAFAMMGCELIVGMTELDIYDELPDASSGSAGGGGSASSSSGSTGAGGGGGGGGGGAGGAAGSCTTVNGCIKETASADNCGSPTVLIQFHEGAGSPFLTSNCMKLNPFQTVQFARESSTFTCTLKGGSPGNPDPTNPIQQFAGPGGLVLTISPQEIPLSGCSVPFFCDNGNMNAKGAIFFDSSCQ